MQTITSAATSLAQVPALFRSPRYQLGPLNLDIGGGKYDKGTLYLASRGITSLVLDPYNRSAEHNDKVRDKVREAGGADSVTVCNVLNVIDSDEALLNVIEDAATYLSPTGTAFFQIYEGDRSCKSKVTSKGYQRNEPAANYLSDVALIFATYKRNGNIILASSPLYRSRY